MTRKILIGIGSIISLYFFLSIVFPKYIGVPFASYQSKKIWTEHEQRLKQEKDSITTFPKPIGYINDFSNLFTNEQVEKLEKRLVDYEKNTTREIAIITIDSIKPYTNIKDFATDLSNH